MVTDQVGVCQVVSDEVSDEVPDELAFGDQRIKLRRKSIRENQHWRRIVLVDLIFTSAVGCEQFALPVIV